MVENGGGGEGGYGRENDGEDATGDDIDDGVGDGCCWLLFPLIL